MTPEARADVPILVETPARRSFPLIRCQYLAIEFDNPEDGWNIRIGGLSAPFLLLDLAGVVLRPVLAAQFNALPVIEDFFERVEAADGLVVFEDLWLPATLFFRETKVNDVYRVGLNLFRAAFEFRDSRISRRELEIRCEELRNEIRFSKVETFSFGKWAYSQISEMEHGEPKNPELRLRTKNERQRE